MRYIDNRQLLRLKDLTDINSAKAEITALPEAERSNYIDDNGSRWSALKTELWTIGNMKCWYSEAVIQRQEGHVEHYRPKKKPHGLNGEQHPGYWWRAFDWTNFRIAHPTSNVRITDYLTGKVAGKGAYFPLREGCVRAQNEASEPTEVPVLLDPTVQGDCRLLCFDSNEGKPIPTFTKDQDEWKNKRALDSISYYHLDEGTWNYMRKDLMDDISVLCDKLIEEAGAVHANAALCDEFIDELIGYIDEHQPFTAACRQVIKEKGLLDIVV